MLPSLLKGTHLRLNTSSHAHMVVGYISMLALKNYQATVNTLDSDAFDALMTFDLNILSAKEAFFRLRTSNSLKKVLVD